MIFQNFGFNQNYPVAAPAPPAAQPILWVDAGNASSYNGSGSVWYDITSLGNNGSISNAVYSAITGGTFYFNGTNGKDRKSTRLNSSHSQQSRMPSSA